MDGGNGQRWQGSSRKTKSIRVDFDRLTTSGRLTWNAANERHAQADRVLRVLVGSGRGCVLHGTSMPPTILVPLRGRVRLTDGESSRSLRAGQLFVGEAGQRLQAVSSADALWIAFVAPVAVWRQLFNSTAETSIPDPILLPALHTADRAIRRAAVHLAREAARAGTGKPDAIAAALRFALLLIDLQSEFDPLIDNCPGRTLAQRRNVFLRLQRVCNYMESNSELTSGIAGFARVANYSTCHFVRTFSAVYGQTPHAVLMEKRLKRALHLVSDTELSITEVAHASGFEDRCAFARSFKRRFGRTATALRERSRKESVAG